MSSWKKYITFPFNFILQQQCFFFNTRFSDSWAFKIYWYILCLKVCLKDLNYFFFMFQIFIFFIFKWRWNIRFSFLFLYRYFSMMFDLCTLQRCNHHNYYDGPGCQQSQLLQLCIILFNKKVSFTLYLFITR